MARFDQAYQRVAKAEGGYQKHPNDTGNYNSRGELVGTNWGINAQVYEAWINRPPTESDMRNMPKSLAATIYKNKYWDRIKGDYIENQAVAEILFDGHVNHGYTGIKMMQEVLNLQKDGIVGPDTLNALNTGNQAHHYNAYKQRRIDFYHWLANNRPGLDVFLPGWLNRINRFNDFSSSNIYSNPKPQTAGGGSLWLLLLFTPLLFHSK